MYEVKMAIINIDDDAADSTSSLEKRQGEDKQRRKTAIGIFDERKQQAEEFEFEERRGRSSNRIRSRAVDFSGESTGEIVLRGGELDLEVHFESKADMASWSGQPTIKGSTEQMRMALLTFSLVGLQ